MNAALQDNLYGEYGFEEMQFKAKSNHEANNGNTTGALYDLHEAHFEMDASLMMHDCSNSPGSNTGLKKKKTGNSKNYIGKQNLFQEFQSDDVTKVRDNDNKFIIGEYGEDVMCL